MTRPVAITKVQAVNQLSIEVEEWLAKAIPALNVALKNFKDGSIRSVDANEFGLGKLSSDAQQRAVDEVITTYANQGWKVRHRYGGQMDGGSYFDFS